MANPKTTPITSSEIPSGVAGTSNNFADTFIDTLDTKKIQSLEEQVKKLKEDTSKKVYAVKMSAGLLEDLISFVEENAEWAQTESLGVIEVHKTLDKIRHEEIKDNTILSEIKPWELFNSNTKIKIMIGNNHNAMIDVTNKKIIFRNRNFTSLANIIELIKQIENMNPKRKYEPYNFVDWYNEKTKIWTSISNTFTKDFLEKNGKQN